MAEFTHAAFRQLVAELGGCDLFWTEMLNSRIVAGTNPERDPFLDRGDRDRPLVAQLVGGDPDTMARAARRLEAMGFDAVDINMGCARRAITRHGWGIALMSDAPRARAVVRAVRRAVRLPLLAKLRALPGHDARRLEAFARSLVEEGLDALVLHPRAAADGFKRPARWAEIGALAAALPVPVIGNGDVTDPEACRRLLRETGCAGVMIGRAALVRPWIFREIAAGRPWAGDLVEVARHMGRLVEDRLPPDLRRRRFLAWCAWYLRNWAHGHHLLGLVRREPDIDAMLAALERATDGQQLLQRPFYGRL